MKFSPAPSVTPELAALWARAHYDVVAKRGGLALMATLLGDVPESDFLDHVVATSSLWVYEEDDEPLAFCLYRQGVVEAAYVSHDHRRKKIATTMVRSLLAGLTPPIDAYALPGDRATKSLYESLGWKARLLTMRGA